jgi:hypothetical protein
VSVISVGSLTPALWTPHMRGQMVSQRLPTVANRKRSLVRTKVRNASFFPSHREVSLSRARMHALGVYVLALTAQKLTKILFYTLCAVATTAVGLRLTIRLRYGLRKLFPEDVLIIFAWVWNSADKANVAYICFVDSDTDFGARGWSRCLVERQILRGRFYLYS